VRGDRDGNGEEDPKGGKYWCNGKGELWWTRYISDRRWLGMGDWMARYYVIGGKMEPDVKLPEEMFGKMAGKHPFYEAQFPWAVGRREGEQVKAEVRKVDIRTSDEGFGAVVGDGWYIDPITLKKVQGMPPTVETGSGSGAAKTSSLEESKSTEDCHPKNIAFKAESPVSDLGKSEIDAFASKTTLSEPPKASQSSKPWLTREGFSTAEESSDSRPGIAKIESSLDRRLREDGKEMPIPTNSDFSTSSQGNPTNGKPLCETPARKVLEYRVEENTAEDVDLLRASDIRASSKFRVAAEKESYEVKQGRWDKLEEFWKNRDQTLENEHEKELNEIRQQLYKARDKRKKAKETTLGTGGQMADFNPPMDVDPEASVIGRLHQGMLLKPAKDDTCGEPSQIFQNDMANSTLVQVPIQKTTTAEHQRQDKAMEAAKMGQERKEKAQKASDAILASEVAAQKIAMAALENRQNFTKLKDDVPLSVFAEWNLQQKSLKSSDEREQQEKDKALVNEVKCIYEEEYGTIDAEHRQPNAAAPAKGAETRTIQTDSKMSEMRQPQPSTPPAGTASKEIKKKLSRMQKDLKRLQKNIDRSRKKLDRKPSQLSLGLESPSYKPSSKAGVSPRRISDETDAHANSPQIGTSRQTVVQHLSNECDSKRGLPTQQFSGNGREYAAVQGLREYDEAPRQPTDSSQQTRNEKNTLLEGSRNYHGLHVNQHANQRKRKQDITSVLASFGLPQRRTCSKLDEEVQEHVPALDRDAARRRNDTGPQVYKVLALNSASKKVEVTTTTSSLNGCTKHRSVSTILVHLEQPTKFFSHMDSLGAAGYELIDGNRTMLIYKQVENAQPDSTGAMQNTIKKFLKANGELNSEAAASSFVETRRGDSDAPGVVLGAAASQARPVPSQAVEATTQTTTETATPSSTHGPAPDLTTTTNSSPLIYREEPVFTGSQAPSARARTRRQERLNQQWQQQIQTDMHALQAGERSRKTRQRTQALTAAALLLALGAAGPYVLGALAESKRAEAEDKRREAEALRREARMQRGGWF
jgi:hypothetical protein